MVKFDVDTIGVAIFFSEDPLVVERVIYRTTIHIDTS